MGGTAGERVVGVVVVCVRFRDGGPGEGRVRWMEGEWDRTPVEELALMSGLFKFCETVSE